VNDSADDAQQDEGGEHDDGSVVVPHVPGPIVRLHRPVRSRDDLDELIDELFPDTDEGPGWFDAGLVAIAAGLVGWGLAGGPTGALVVGGIALFLGSILPVRWVWRRVDRRRQLRRQRALVARGVPLDLGHVATAHLVRMYDDLRRACAGAGSTAGAAGASGPEVAAAHSAVLEVATLLGGRTPESADEIAYVGARAAAIERLALVMREPRAGSEPAGPDPALVIEARNELDSLTGANALTRLDELTAEARHGRADA
jgi:hypothetical protein